jgi:hypothetical protein
MIKDLWGDGTILGTFVRIVASKSASREQWLIQDAIM